VVIFCLQESKYLYFLVPVVNSQWMFTTLLMGTPACTPRRQQRVILWRSMSIFAERVSGRRNFRDTQNSCPISLFLIGQHGKYAIRLEEKYCIKITQSTEIGEGNNLNLRKSWLKVEGKVLLRLNPSSSMSVSNLS
jgi:hypothetical protein